MFELSKLKQYFVDGPRFELGNVTICPEIESAVEIPGHAVDPKGMSSVSTVQFDVFELTVNPLGNITCTELSIPLSELGVVAHTMPPVLVETVCLVSRIML